MKKLSQTLIFSVFIHSQEAFNAGAQDISDAINAMYENYLETQCTEEERERQERAREMYFDGKPMQDIWLIIDPTEEE